MAKVWGLNIPVEFAEGFKKFLKENWQGTTQKITIADTKPARARSAHIAGRSFIPDFIDEWADLVEVQQDKWAKDWGSGGQQAYALFFQNNYYRQINFLQLRNTPNFFTAPAGWLHIATGDTSVILRFDCTSGDYILTDPANILHEQARTTCEFEAAYTINATIKAKLQNISTPGTAQCQATITQYYTDNTGDHSRQEVVAAKNLNGAALEYIISHTFTQDDPSEVITGFRIDFDFTNAVGDIWFYSGEVSVVDDVLGVVRLHNVVNLQDIEKIFSYHLLGVKNQWSLSGAGSGTTLRRVFPYAFGYPEEEPIWTERRPAGDADKNWREGEIDSDGSNLIAAERDGRLYTSADGGVSWTERHPAGDADKTWEGVASDDDGSNLIACAYGGRLYTSADGGVSWTERRPAGDANKNWYGCASDADGSNLIAIIRPGRLYTSADGGVSWTERRPAGDADIYWKAVASDDDGSNLIACANGGRLYTSADGGVSWTERRPAGDGTKYWASVGSDADGSNLIAGLTLGRLYTSADGGVSWTERRPAGDADKTWFDCASDADGSNLIACVSVGRLYTSADGGVSWTERRPAGDADRGWCVARIDADGSNLLAAVNGGRLYTYGEE